MNNKFIFGLSILWLTTSLHAYDIDRHLQSHDCPPLIDAYIVEAIIHVESSGRSQAESLTGARGLMQVSAIALRHYNDAMPGERQIGYGQLFVDEHNLAVGIWLLCWAYDYAGNLNDALMVYHGGAGLFKRVRGSGEDGILQKYVDKVIEYSMVGSTRIQTVKGS